MSASNPRPRWLAVFLWISVFAWATGFGAKLFELTVLISAWSANPPESLTLLPYGPRWPFNPGEFFQPLSAFLVIGIVGSLIAGWHTVRSFKLWLWLAVACLVAIWAATPTLFWPIIDALYFASTGEKPIELAEIVALTHRWIVLDWIREGLIGVGFVASVQAIATQHRAYAA